MSHGLTDGDGVGAGGGGRSGGGSGGMQFSWWYKKHDREGENEKEGEKCVWCCSVCVEWKLSYVSLLSNSWDSYLYV